MLETRHALGIARECFGEDFQRDIAPELGIPCAAHLAHPARINTRENFIGAQAVARSERPLGAQ
jgi:hypothetical protein